MEFLTERCGQICHGGTEIYLTERCGQTCHRGTINLLDREMWAVMSPGYRDLLDERGGERVHWLWWWWFCCLTSTETAYGLLWMRWLGCRVPQYCKVPKPKFARSARSWTLQKVYHHQSNVFRWWATGQCGTTYSAVWCLDRCEATGFIVNTSLR